MYSRYGSGAKDILEMEFEDGMMLLREGETQRNDEKLYLRWVFGYQMTMNFQDFKGLLVENKTNDKRSAEEILKEVRDIANGTV